MIDRGYRPYKSSSTLTVWGEIFWWSCIFWLFLYSRVGAECHLFLHTAGFYIMLVGGIWCGKITLTRDSIKTFRVSRKAFSYISGKIRHLLERETVAEQPVSPEERLAICLCRLGRGDYSYTIGEMSNLGTSMQLCQKFTKPSLMPLGGRSLKRHAKPNLQQACINFRRCGNILVLGQHMMDITFL